MNIYQTQAIFATILTFTFLVFLFFKNKSTSTSYAGVYTGVISKPDDESCQIMRERALLEYGILVNDNSDYGGAYLSGTFQLRIDSDNNVTEGLSFVEIHGIKMPFLGGRVPSNGKFYLLADGALPFEGVISNGNISGKATGMEGQSWVWGDIIGRII